MNASDSVRQQNPLGKIPALVLEDGTVLFDSRVILDYLDHRAGGGRIVPRDAGARFAALRLQALADGVMDASVLLVYEGRFRPAERHEPRWLDHQSGKVARTLAALEAAPPEQSAPPDVGQIALACALGYRDFRFEGTWRRDHQSPGSIASPRACRPSPQPPRRHGKRKAPGQMPGAPSAGV